MKSFGSVGCRQKKYWPAWILAGLISVIVALVGIVWGCGMNAKQNLAKRTPPPGQLVDVGGYWMHINCTGQGEPAVIMEAGLNEFSVQWTNIQAEVSRFSRVCSYDRAGFGWSEKSPHPRTGGVMVEELHRLLDKAKISGPYVLVGHSFGGMNMRLYAHRYPDEVAGMVLVDAAHEAQSDRVPALKKAVEPALEQFRFLSALSSLGILALAPENIPARGLAGPALDQYRGILATTNYFDTAFAETEMLERSFAEVRDANIKTLGNIPLVVLSRGLNDTLPGATEEENRQYESSWHAMQAELAALSNHGTQVVASRSGHYIHLAQPQLVVEAIRDVMAKCR